MDSTPAGAAFWRDDPITSASDDTLGRGHVARRAADLVIESHSWESSVVIGLIGPWGSGKSTLLWIVKPSCVGVRVAGRGLGRCTA